MSGAIDLSSARELMAWAREDAEEFDSVVKAYLTGYPYSRFEEDDPETGHVLLKVTVAPLPNRLCKLASHALWDLKHALDHATHAAVAAVTGVAPKDAHFPWASHPNDLTGKLTHRNGKYPPELHAVFRSFEPYPTGDRYAGGDDVFVALNKLANTSKHAVVLNANARFAMNHFDGTGGIVCIYDDAWDRAKQQLTIGRFVKGAHGHVQLEFSSFVEFGEIEALQGHPAGNVLEAFAKAVSEIVDDIETAVAAILAARA